MNSAQRLDELDVHVLVLKDTGAVLVGGADEPDDAEHVAAVDDGRADGKGFAAEVAPRAAGADEMLAGRLHDERAPDAHDVAVGFALGADVFPDPGGIEARPGEAVQARVHDFHVHADHAGDEFRIVGHRIPDVQQHGHSGYPDDVGLTPADPVPAVGEEAVRHGRRAQIEAEDAFVRQGPPPAADRGSAARGSWSCRGR